MLVEVSFAAGCLIVQIWNLISLQSEHWSAIPLAPGSFGHWLTGRGLPAGELARQAGVTPQTASSHLKLLAEPEKTNFTLEPDLTV